LLDRRHWWRTPATLARLLRCVSGPNFPYRVPDGVWRRVGERALWLYEFDARIRGRHRFGAPADQLNDQGLVLLFAPFMPNGLDGPCEEGICAESGELLMRDPGFPVFPQDSSLRSRLPPIGGETDWFWPVCEKTGVAALVPLRFNLLASDRAIRAWLTLHKDRLRIQSVNSTMQAVQRLREKLCMPTRKSSIVGDRRVPPEWDWIEWKDAQATKSGPKLSVAQLNRLQDARAMWKGFCVSGGLQWVTDARRFSRAGVALIRESGSVTERENGYL